MNFTGMRFTGNRQLCSKKKTAIFASRKIHENALKNALHWAKSIDAATCAIEPFHSRLEKKVLHMILEQGASAIWLLGCKFTDSLSKEEEKALKTKRLLIVSCFNRKRHNEFTARYCNHLAILYAENLVFLALNENGILSKTKLLCSHSNKTVITC